MEFIYDILLDFQEEYCDFFEWQIDDKIMNVKRIPLYKVSSKDYLILKYNEVVLQDNVFLKKHRIILVTNGIEVMGLLLNNTNKIIKRSSLLLEDSEDILGYLPQLKTTVVKYIENNKRTINYEGRLHREKKNYIEQFLNKINLKTDEYLLKYLYYDIYNMEEEDLNKIYKKLCDLKKTNINKLYSSIRIINSN